MAQKVSVQLLCDMHDEEVQADETVIFGQDGSHYEIDLCNEHAGELRAQLSRYVAGARRAGRGSAAKRTASDGPNPSEVRAWAKASGYDVPERGRLPQNITDAFLDSQKAGSSKATASGRRNKVKAS